TNSATTLAEARTRTPAARSRRNGRGSLFPMVRSRTDHRLLWSVTRSPQQRAGIEGETHRTKPPSNSRVPRIPLFRRRRPQPLAEPLQAVGDGEPRYVLDILVP